MPSLATLTLYLLAGTAIGLLALLSGIPAAPLAGALLGAGIVSMSGQLEPATWPPGTRTVLEIGIGTVIGTGLTRASLEQLQLLWRPAVLITLALVLTGLVVGLWTSRLLGIDPVVALLGAAPGGISGMSLVGAEFGVGAAVAALHALAWPGRVQEGTEGWARGEGRRDLLVDIKALCRKARARDKTPRKHVVGAPLPERQNPGLRGYRRDLLALQRVRRVRRVVPVPPQPQVFGIECGTHQLQLRFWVKVRGVQAQASGQARGGERHGGLHREVVLFTLRQGNCGVGHFPG